MRFSRATKVEVSRSNGGCGFFTSSFMRSDLSRCRHDSRLCRNPRPPVFRVLATNGPASAQATARQARIDTNCFAEIEPHSKFCFYSPIRVYSCVFVVETSCRCTVDFVANKLRDNIHASIRVAGERLANTDRSASLSNTAANAHRRCVRTFFKEWGFRADVFERARHAVCPPAGRELRRDERSPRRPRLVGSGRSCAAAIARLAWAWQRNNPHPRSTAGAAHFGIGDFPFPILNNIGSQASCLTRPADFQSAHTTSKMLIVQDSLEGRPFAEFRFSILITCCCFN
jgi:hypothetical protein